MSTPLIELDLSEPWEPPDVPAPRRPARRWALAALVLIAALLLNSAAQPSGSLRPVLVLPDQTLPALLGGERLYVVRHDRAVSRLEAVRLRDGATLWSMPISLQIQVVEANDQRVLLAGVGNGATIRDSDLIALDGATGRELWRSRGPAIVYVNARVLVKAEFSEPDPDSEPPPQLPADAASRPNPEPLPRWTRYVALSIASGAELWSRTLTERTAHTLLYDSRYDWSNQRAAWPERLSLAELDRDGALRIRDVETDQVRARYRLDFSGRVSDFNVIGDRVIVYETGEVGGVVYDLVTGRRLWRLAPRPVEYSPIVACGSLLCRADRDGTWAYDPTTGRQLWRLGNWNAIRWYGDQRLLFTAYASGPSGLPGDGRGAALVDARTGRVTELIEGWTVISVTPSGRLLVWANQPKAGAIIAMLDPVTRTVMVIGKAEEWFGPPACSYNERFLACTNATRLSVWRLADGTMA